MRVFVLPPSALRTHPFSPPSPFRTLPWLILPFPLLRKRKREFAGTRPAPFFRPFCSGPEKAWKQGTLASRMGGSHEQPAGRGCSTRGGQKDQILRYRRFAHRDLAPFGSRRQFRGKFRENARINLRRRAAGRSEGETAVFPGVLCESERAGPCRKCDCREDNCHGAHGQSP